MLGLWANRRKESLIQTHKSASRMQLVNTGSVIYVLYLRNVTSPHKSAGEFSVTQFYAMQRSSLRWGFICFKADGRAEPAIKLRFYFRIRSFWQKTRRAGSLNRVFAVMFQVPVSTRFCRVLRVLAICHHSSKNDGGYQYPISYSQISQLITKRLSL